MIATMSFQLAIFSACLSFARAQAQTPLVIPLTADNNGRYVAHVTMSDSSPQSFGFALSTSSGYTVVAGATCSSCNDTPTYNQAASSSAQPLPGSLNVTLPGTSLSGSTLKENCTLNVRNGSPWRYSNQTIIVSNISSTMFGPITSGLLGLGLNSRSGSFSDTVFGGVFQHQPNQTSFTFAMALKGLTPSSRSGDDAGVLHWRAADPSAYSGTIETKNVLPPTQNASSDWVVSMDGWGVTGAGGTVVEASQDLPTTLDPFLPLMYWPQAEASLIYQKIPGANAGISDGLSQLWTVPCNSIMTFSVTFGTKTFILKQSTLVIAAGDGSCIGAIKGWVDPSRSDYLLGAIFISTVYMIFNVPTNPSNSPASIGFATPAGLSTAMSGKIIAGITIGSIAGLVFIGLGMWFLLRRRTRRKIAGKADDVPVEKVGEIRPFLDRSPLNPGFTDGSAPGQSAYSPPNTASSFGNYGRPLSQQNGNGEYITPPNSAGLSSPPTREEHRKRRNEQVRTSTATVASLASAPATSNSPIPEAPETDAFQGVAPPTFEQATGRRQPDNWSRDANESGSGNGNGGEDGNGDGSRRPDDAHRRHRKS